MEYQPLSKKAISCMRTSALISAILFALMFSGIIVAMFFSEAPAQVLTISYIAAGVFIIWSAANIIVVPVIRHKRYKYLISSERVEVIEGLIFVKRSIVPVDRIHQILLEKGPIDSAFKLAKVKIITAGGMVVINLLEEEKANIIAENLKILIERKIKRGGAENNGLQ